MRDSAVARVIDFTVSGGRIDASGAVEDANGMSSGVSNEPSIISTEAISEARSPHSSTI